jgi:molybdopterin/thiamine biosynthesis adenylyltransferase
MSVRIAFCGVGALGSSAVVMSRNLEARLRLIDFDRVESKNLLAQAFVKQSIGKNKADALRLQLSNFYGVKVESFGRRLSSDNCQALLGEADLLVDCFDNAASRKLLSDFARDSSKPLVHAAISGDGTFGIVRWDERFAPDEEDEEGQATCEGGEHLPLINLVAASLARAIQDFLRSGDKRDSMVSLNAVTPTHD